MPNPTRRALPWATAAGAIALVAGTIAGVPGAVAATSPAVNAFGIPAVAPQALSTTGDSIATPVAKSAKAAKAAAAPAAPVAVAKPAKTVKAANPALEIAKKYSYFDSDFILRLRGSAVQPEADIPKPLTPGVGYSAVNLEKDTGGPVAKCEIFGAGYYATDIVQEGILENSGPPDAGNKGGGIFNPTESKDTAPNLSPGENLNSRKPRVKDVTDGKVIYEVPHNGNGVRWEAKCDGDNGGTGTGSVDLAGLYAAGSATTGKVDKVTGVYTGQSRAYAAGLAAGLDAVSSTAKVTHLPGQKPVVDYRIGAAGGTIAEGASIPYGSLTEQFNSQLGFGGPASGAMAALGPFGLALMGPTESISENGGRYIINFPFFEIQQGVNARKGTAGENQRVRLVNIDFEGLYVGGALKPPSTAGF